MTISLPARFLRPTNVRLGHYPMISLLLLDKLAENPVIVVLCVCMFMGDNGNGVCESLLLV